MASKLTACLAMAGVASFASAEFISLAKRTTEAPSATEIEIPDVTAVTNCHMHDTDVWCQADGTEFSVQATPTVASSFTDCHSHGSEMYVSKLLILL
jgi:zinc transporter 1/2/3